MKSYAPDYTPEESATRETRDLCPTDRYLREHGYQIVSRPNGGEAVCRFGRHGEAIGQAEALRRIDEKRRATEQSK